MKKQRKEIKLESIINKYHIMDSRNIVQFMPKTKTIDVTITSPPYWNLKNYGSDNQIGFGQSYINYLDDLEKVFAAIYKSTKNTGSLWVISDTLKEKGEMKLLPFDLAYKLKEVGWILQDIIIWNKDRTLPWSHKGKLRNIFEYVAFYTKSTKFRYNIEQVREIDKLQEWWIQYPERYSPNGKAPARLWYYAIPQQGSWSTNWVRHFNPLPPQLIERIILLTTNKNDVVLDPFAGSGIVLAQAEAMGRKFLGFDLNRSYKNMYYLKVRPEIIKLINDQKQKASKSSNSKRKFAELILGLRFLKYSKELVRLYRIKYNEPNINGIVSLKYAKNNTRIIYFIFSNKESIPINFLDKLKLLAEKPPLSKYGMSIILRTMCLSSISSAWFIKCGVKQNSKLSIYKSGQTYSAYGVPIKASSFTREVLLHKSNNRSYRCPTIISNIHVNISKENNTIL